MVVTTQPITQKRATPMTEDTTEVLAGAIRVDEQQLRGHIDEAVRCSVEESLNGLLEAEADAICERDAMNARPIGSTPEPGTTSASLRPRPGKFG